MKKLLIGLLLVSTSAVAYKDEPIKPKGSSEYVDDGRFISTYMPNPMDYIITDTKTGCQYMTGASYKNATLLGCFDEYKKAKK